VALLKVRQGKIERVVGCEQNVQRGEQNSISYATWTTQKIFYIIFLDYIIWNIDHLTNYEGFLIFHQVLSILDYIIRKIMSSYTLCNTILTNFLYILNTLKPSSFLTQSSHTLLLLPSTTMCFHSWPFIKRSYFGNSRIVWTVKVDGVALQRSTICLGVLVCLDARLTIKVSYAIERKQTLPHTPHHTHTHIFFSLSIALHYWFNLRFLID